MHASTHVPAVSVGMPVYDGERYLEEAIGSVLRQTQTDLELVISDNASTDRTGDICRSFAAADPRVRYYRNEVNLGAHPNFNRAFELSRGGYFKWAAHDDVLKPDFLRCCVEALESVPDAAVCQSAIEYIDESGASLGIHRHHVAGSESEDSARRFAAMTLRPHDCYSMMGVLRRSLVEQCMPLASFHGADRALLARIALAGRFITVPNTLLQVRDHAGRYSRAQKGLRDRAAWYDARNVGRLSFPVWRLYGTYWSSVVSAEIPRRIKFRAASTLLRWWLVNFNAIRMAVDVAGSVAPGIVDAAESVKQTIFSPAPGADEVRRSHRR
jgi:glycosyltransferase involved in cell wall biosynthesis